MLLFLQETAEGKRSKPPVSQSLFQDPAASTLVVQKQDGGTSSSAGEQAPSLSALSIKDQSPQPAMMGEIDPASMKLQHSHSDASSCLDTYCKSTARKHAKDSCQSLQSMANSIRVCLLAFLRTMNIDVNRFPWDCSQYDGRSISLDRVLLKVHACKVWCRVSSSSPGVPC